MKYYMISMLVLLHSDEIVEVFAQMIASDHCGSWLPINRNPLVDGATASNLGTILRELPLFPLRSVILIRPSM